MSKKYADMDPLEEIRAIREEIGREFKTVSAYGEYLQKKYPSANTLVEPPCNATQPAAKRILSRMPKTNKKASGQRKVAKRFAHA